MKKLKIYNFCILSLLLILTGISFSQEVSKADITEKAHVYFVRVSQYATHAIYYIIDHDSLIHISEGLSWTRYLCHPGEHLFWVTNRDNEDFMTANLKAGKSYMAIIHSFPGFGKSNMQLLPVNEESKWFTKGKELIMEEEESKTIEEDIFYKMKSLKKRKVIQKTLSRYENEWKDEKNYELMDDSFIIDDKEFKDLLLQ
mgnify:CR=1 FL=1